MFRVELAKAAHRWRTWVLALVLGAVPALLVLAIVLNPPPPGAGPGFLTLATRNGLFAPVAALALVMPFLLPLAAGLLSGDAIAGEASAGTLRYLLVRPVRRGRFVLGKYLSVVAMLVGGVGVIVAVGLLVGGLTFGLGPLPSLSGGTLSVGEALLRIAAAGLYAVAGVAALAAVGLFLSSLTESGPGATVATVAVAIIGQILGALPQLEGLHPWLLNTYWLNFIELFRTPIDVGPLRDGLLVFAAYSAVFVGLTLATITRRDVLS